MKTLMLLLVLFLPVRANAGLDEEMNGMFADMINATPGGYYETQRRGVIAGGSLVTRNKIMHPNLLSFAPPSVKGGCGGIDMYMGSFSYINGTQITNLLRSVAQGAVGYAFQLAIEGMCPTCAQVMTKLQKDIAQINGLMKNSCEAAQKIVNATGLDEWHNKDLFNVANNNVVNSYLNSDYFSSKEQSNPVKDAVQTSHADTVTGNVVHQALNTSSAKDWFVHGDDQLQRVLMSLTGTMVKNIDPNDNGNLLYQYREPTLDISDFIQGGEVEIYKCADGQCLLNDANPKETITIKGMRETVATMLFGTGTTQYDSGGIVRKQANRDGMEEYTADEQKFLKTASPGVLGLLNRVAAQPASAALVGQQMIGVVATTMTNQLLDEMFRAVRDSVANTGVGLDAKMMELMRDRKQEIDQQRAANAQSEAAINNLLDIQAKLERALKSGKPNQG